MSDTSKLFEWQTADLLGASRVTSQELVVVPFLPRFFSCFSPQLPQACRTVRARLLHLARLIWRLSQPPRLLSPCLFEASTSRCKPTRSLPLNMAEATLWGPQGG